MSIFYPTRLKPHITAITEEELRALGVRGLLLDVDNTLTTHGSQEVSAEVVDWLRRMEAAGFLPTVVSNALPRRVAPFAGRLGLTFIAFACKPLPIGFLRAAKRLGLKKKQCVVIGDQTFTDILGARLCGIPCIQLLPIQLETNKPLMLYKRRLENGILKRYRRTHPLAPVDAEKAAGQDTGDATPDKKESP